MISKFKNNSDLNKTTLRKYAIQYIPYVCECCGNDGEWLGKKISLQLDHINGINNDNRIENLRFLCPNCHSQTDTFGGKNKNNKMKIIGEIFKIIGELDEENIKRKNQKKIKVCTKM